MPSTVIIGVPFFIATFMFGGSGFAAAVPPSANTATIANPLIPT